MVEDDGVVHATRRLLGHPLQQATMIVGVGVRILVIDRNRTEDVRVSSEGTDQPGTQRSILDGLLLKLGDRVAAATWRTRLAVVAV